jgi:alkylhydroperoxidase family enzyme
MDIHSSRGMKNGVPMEKIAALDAFREDPRFSIRERIAIGFAEGMTQTGKEVSDAEFAEAQEAFTTEELVELAGVIALENFRSKFNRLFRIEAQGFCAIPDKN